MNRDTVASYVTRILEEIGEDPSREGLRDTPQRVAKAFEEIYSGYGVLDVKAVLKSFTDGHEVSQTDEMVVVGKIPFYSRCEHHMESIFGFVWIGYVPNKRIVGLSKFKRLVDVYARRLQVQERLTAQIADALGTALNPRGIAVLVKARHMCMEARGVNTPGTETTTTALRGVFKKDAAARAEFLSYCKE